MCPLLFEVFDLGLRGLHRGADGVCGIDIAFRLQHLVMDEGLHGSVFFHFREVVQIFDDGFAVTGHTKDQRIEDGGHQTAGKTVVIQVHTGHGVAGIQHHGGVEETGDDAVRPAKVAGYGSKGGAEQTGQLHRGVAEGPVHHKTAQEYTAHDGNDIAGMFAVSGETHDSQDTAHGGTVQDAAAQIDKCHADQTVHTGVDQNRTHAEHTQIVGGGTAGGLQQKPVAGPVCPDGPL